MPPFEISPDLLELIDVKQNEDEQGNQNERKQDKEEERKIHRRKTWLRIFL